jgi:hypothetical protein
MVTSRAGKAERRTDETQAAIRASLTEAAPRAGLNEAVALLQGEMAKLHRYRPGDAELAYAEVAATILVLAGQIHTHKPRRPAGCPPRPRPGDLLRVFDRALDRALRTGESHA